MYVVRSIDDQIDGLKRLFWSYQEKSFSNHDVYAQKFDKNKNCNYYCV